MMKMKKILFPTDFTKHSRTVFKYAVSLARDMKAKLHILYVKPTTMSQPMAACRDDVPSLFLAVRDGGKDRFQAAVFAQRMAAKPAHRNAALNRRLLALR